MKPTVTKEEILGCHRLGELVHIALDLLAERDKAFRDYEQLHEQAADFLSERDALLRKVERLEQSARAREQLLRDIRDNLAKADADLVEEKRRARSPREAVIWAREKAEKIADRNINWPCFPSGQMVREDCIENIKDALLEADNNGYERGRKDWNKRAKS